MYILLKLNTILVQIIQGHTYDLQETTINHTKTHFDCVYFIFESLNIFETWMKL